MNGVHEFSTYNMYLKIQVKHSIYIYLLGHASWKFYEFNSDERFCNCLVARFEA